MLSRLQPVSLVRGRAEPGIEIEAAVARVTRPEPRRVDDGQTHVPAAHAGAGPRPVSAPTRRRIRRGRARLRPPVEYVAALIPCGHAMAGQSALERYVYRGEHLVNAGRVEPQTRVKAHGIAVRREHAGDHQARRWTLRLIAPQIAARWSPHRVKRSVR